MIIREINIDNFKSLNGFKINLAHFNCLIGLNGAGKSTILQAFDFLGQMMVGRMQEWLNQRDWKNSDLLCRFQNKKTIFFKITFEEGDKHIVWEGSFNSQTLRCTSETISETLSTGSKKLLRVADNQFSVGEESYSPISFDYQGSILSQLKESFLRVPILLALKQFMLNIKSLELLSPHLIRKKEREASDIGVGGEKLSAYLSKLESGMHDSLMEKLTVFYPRLKDFWIKPLRSGWKELRIKEDYNQGLETEAHHINDGMLRLIAIIAQVLGRHDFLLFDEIENGMNPELIQKLVDFLIESPKQIIVTTHSPLILNYLDDETAKKGVILIYKTPEGNTKSQRFFDSPLAARKLESMGAGEVFADTYLEDIVNEAGAH